MGKILLFYKYITVPQPQAIVNWQKELCNSLGLKGRIIIAPEGINGTLGGRFESIEKYKTLMNNHELFNNIDFKEAEGDENHFPRLRIVVKKEIVHFGQDINLINVKDGGVHLTPRQAHALIENKSKNLVLLDTRNDYESRVGTFQDAIIPNTKTFREFPEYIDKNLDQFKDKEVLMFCTGGVRCERASAYLKLKGVAKEVYQIQGGIHRYVEEYPDGFFKGKNYVFDGRVTVRVTKDILTNCVHCKIKFDDYTNCVNAECNEQIIVCPDCIKTYHNTCSQVCLDLVKNKSVNIRVTPRNNEKVCQI